MSSSAWAVIGSVAGVVAVIFAALQLHVQIQDRRHRRKIEKLIQGHEALVSAPEVGDFRSPPFGLAPKVLRGRDSIVDELVAALNRDEGEVHLLCGLGGVGKSSIALDVARRAQMQDRTIWWITASDRDSLARAYLDIVRTSFSVSPVELEAARSNREVLVDLFWRRLEADEYRWILILDNADDLSIFDIGSRRVGDGQTWIRRARRGLTIITSRHVGPTSWGSHVLPHHVPSLDVDSGAAVLLDLAPTAGTLAEAKELASILGFLPLALNLAGRHLSSPFSTLGTFDSYQHALPAQFLSLMGPEESRDEGQMRRVVVSTWELSLRALTRRGIPEARSMLRLLSCFAEDAVVPLSLLDGSATRFLLHRKRGNDLTTILRALNSVGLVNARTVEGSASLGVAVHPMVATTTWNQMLELKSKRIGRYYWAPVDTWMPIIATRLVIEVTAGWRKRESGSRVQRGRGFDGTGVTVVLPSDSGDLGAESEAVPLASERRLMAVHVAHLLRHVATGLPDRELAGLLRAAGSCVPYLLASNSPVGFDYLLTLVNLHLQRWGPDPMWALANMNRQYPEPGVDYSKSLASL